MALQPRRPRLTSSLPLEPQILHGTSGVPTPYHHLDAADDGELKSIEMRRSPMASSLYC
jgi:hypothetical protein